MPSIRILPETVANKIAAGEVVERPASVVKELVENSLDAGATQVSVEVESGGKRLLRVADDGSGMSHDDALLAFERHSTSKLRTAEDLVSIATLGFRGEALPSVAAVSRIVLETRSQEEEAGTRIEIAGGKLMSVRAAGLPPGTCVTVRDLFYNVPARRKFLKSETTELGHIASLVTHYSLAHPEKSFVLKTPTQEIMNVGPVASYQDRIFQLFGKQALDELLELKETKVAAPPAPWETGSAAAVGEPGDTEREPAEMVIRGFVSKPEAQRPNRNAIYVFVNRRLVRDRLILHAIHEAYRNILPSDAFPTVLLFLELPFAEVDVNVHPSKVEVRFRHSAWVHDSAREAIRAALTALKPIASFPSVGRPAQRAAGVAAAGTGPSLQQAIPTDVPMSDGAGFELEPYQPAPEPQRFSFETGEAIPLALSDESRQGVTGILANAPGQPASTAPTTTEAEIANLKPLGQVSNSFIVAVNASGLWIVDQHVAHERVLFERQLRERQAGQVTGQRLLMPMIVQLSPRQQATFDQIAAELRLSGFDVEPFGQRTVAIQSAPTGISTSDLDKLLVELLDGVEKDAQTTNVETLRRKIAASVSCHAAIKINMPLDQRKMEWLLGELAKTDCPMSCPHGRPIVLRYSLREIEKAFKRV